MRRGEMSGSHPLWTIVAFLDAVRRALAGGCAVLPADLRQDREDLIPVALSDSAGIMAKSLHPDLHERD